jgi:hypothetical protein
MAMGVVGRRALRVVGGRAARRMRAVCAVVAATGLLVPLTAAPSAVAVTRSALQLSGANQYVTFGAAPSLATPVFTVETWCKRTGAGIAEKSGLFSAFLVFCLYLYSKKIIQEKACKSF